MMRPPPSPTRTSTRLPDAPAFRSVAYRAQVRAKGSAIRAEQGVPDSAEKAQALLRLALAHLESARVRLVLVGGLPGTGKSTLARGIGRVTGAVVLRPDVVRKEPFEIAPDHPAVSPSPGGIYGPDTPPAVPGGGLSRAGP